MCIRDRFFRTDSLLSVLDRSLMILICSLLLYTNILGGQFSIQWFVYAQTISYIITAVITFAIVLQKAGRFKIRFDLKFFFVFLRKSYPVSYTHLDVYKRQFQHFAKANEQFHPTKTWIFVQSLFQ